jgi:hypothetical protein
MLLSLPWKGRAIANRNETTWELPRRSGASARQIAPIKICQALTGGFHAGTT